MDHLQLTMDKLSVDAVSELVVDDSCGAVSLFVGTTRDNFEGKKVLRLEYEAYEPMALKAMKAICDEVRTKWPAVRGIAMYHRLGNVPCRETSVIIAVSSPHRRDSLDAVSLCIELLKSKVPVWKREVYADAAPAWKENVECPSPPPAPTEHADIDKNLIQINVSNDELQQRIQNFIERKREQVNISNIQDFIPGKEENESEDTCARVTTQFVKRSDSKGHLKIRKVHNEWGPQTVSVWARDAPAAAPPGVEPGAAAGAGAPAPGLPPGVAERVRAVERFLHIAPVAPDIYRRLKAMEDRMAYLQAVSPEYAEFWKSQKDPEETPKPVIDFIYTADDIARKIEQLEKMDDM